MVLAASARSLHRQAIALQLPESAGHLGAVDSQRVRHVPRPLGPGSKLSEHEFAHRELLRCDRRMRRLTHRDRRPVDLRSPCDPPQITVELGRGAGLPHDAAQASDLAAELRQTHAVVAIARIEHLPMQLVSHIPAPAWVAESEAGLHLLAKSSKWGGGGAGHDWDSGGSPRECQRVVTNLGQLRAQPILQLR